MAEDIRNVWRGSRNSTRPLLGRVGEIQIDILPRSLKKEFSTRPGEAPKKAGGGAMIQWNQFPPSAYQWDYIPPSAWKTLNPLAGVVPGGTNNVANFVFELGTMSLNTFLSFLQFAVSTLALL